jgi:hypothetical protein
MTSKILLATATLLCAVASPVFAQPQLTAVPGGLEAGNWVWQVDITPDLLLGGGSTPMALEMGFRLTGSPLVSATNINPTQWDQANPGLPIFGWETISDTDGDGTIETNGDDEPVGLQSNTTTSEIFAAYGSINLTTPGPKPFLRIEALGPDNGGSTSSTIEWLGVYAVGHGRIAQLIAGGTTSANFDIFAGSATQVIPEPASAALLALASVVMSLGPGSRRSRPVARC